MNKEKVYLTVIVLLAIALIVGCAPQSQQTLKTLSVSEIIVPKEGLIFKTEDGKVIAKMVASENGGSLGICNNHGKIVAVVGAEGDSGLLNIYNKQGKKVASMLTSEDLTEIKSEIKIVKEKVSFLAQKPKTVIEPTPKPTPPYQPPYQPPSGYQQERKVECHRCGGTGQLKCSAAQCDGTGHTLSVCHSCRGSGVFNNIRCFSCKGRGFGECSSCDGRGWQKCFVCGGSGYR